MHMSQEKVFYFFLRHRKYILILTNSRKKNNVRKMYTKITKNYSLLPMPTPCSIEQGVGGKHKSGLCLYTPPHPRPFKVSVGH